jgi:hypothetical protein
MAKALDVQLLRSAVVAILDHIEEMGIREVPIADEADFYWDVSDEDLFKVHARQPILGVGRLSDDMEFLESVAKDPSLAVSLLLIHAAPLLRYLGEKIGH